MASPEALAAMLRATAPRGEERYSFSDAAAGCALGLAYRGAFTPTGRRAVPTCLDNDSCTVVLDGQVYNAEEVVASPPGDDDASALAVSGELRDRPDTFPLRLEGPFVFAAWDKRARRLILASEALGAIVLYYYFDPSRSLLVFASELKAVLAHPAVPRRLERRSLALLLRQGFMPWGFGLLQGCRSLGPATRLTLDRSGTMDVGAYWRAQPVQPEGDLDYWIPRVRQAVLETVARAANGAGSLAVFNGGGTDSSILLAALKEAGIPDIRSFTVGFTSRPSPDIVWAERIARRLGVKHQTLLFEDSAVTPDLLQQVTSIMDEPVETLSRWVTEYLLCSRVGAEGVDSCLVGDDCENAFGGQIFWKGVTARMEAVGTDELPAFDEFVTRYFYGSSMFRDEQLHRLLGEEGDCRPLLDERRELFAQRLSPGDVFDYSQIASYLRTSGGRTRIYGHVVPPRFGISKRPAFKDRSLMELSRRIPGRFRGAFRYSENRQVLKAAFADVLPELLQRTDNGAYPGAWFDDLGGVESYLLERAAKLGESGLFRRSAFQRYLGRYRGRSKVRDAERVSLLASIQAWIENYGVDIDGN